MYKVLFLSFTVFLTFLNADDLKSNCNKKAGFIYVKGECINYFISTADRNGLNIILHGTWDSGTNILGRYSTYAQTLSLDTDITTIAIALPAYSKSTSNIYKAIGDKKYKNLSSSKKFVLFVGDIISNLKKKYKAKKVNFIGHSAGAKIGATLAGLRPNLIDNFILVAGQYKVNNKNEIAMYDVFDKIPKNKRFLFIYGSKDKISKPIVTKEAYEFSKKNALNVKLVEVKDGVHLDLEMSDGAIEAISEFLEE